MQDRELYSIEEAQALLGGIARNTIYELMRTASLPSVVIGRRRFISANSISMFIAAASTTVSPAVNGEKPLRLGRQTALEFETQLLLGEPRIFHRFHCLPCKDPRSTLLKF